MVILGPTTRLSAQTPHTPKPVVFKPSRCTRQSAAFSPSSGERSYARVILDLSRTGVARTSRMAA